jgi:Flp pilus assembly protein TadD
LLASVAIGVTLCLGGCKGVDFSSVTGSIATPNSTMPQSDEGVRRFTEQWGKRNEASPTDRVAAINYARGLRAETRFDQAVAVLQKAAVARPSDKEILGAYGKALADAGRYQEAAAVLEHAHTPEHPNWSVLSAQGSVADQLGDHAAAQAYYQAALKIAPGEPSVLSNLGLSYALSKRLPLAEQTMRQAADDPRADARVRQNLSLVLSLEGKFGEAEQISRRDVAPDQAATNVAAIRTMIAQSNTWRQLQSLDGSAKPVAKLAASAKASRSVVAKATPAAAPQANPPMLNAAVEPTDN